MKHCTYISRHPLGFFYYGKGQTDLVLKGKYHGSGVKLKSAFTLPEFAFNTWTSEVINQFDIEDDAYMDEARLVTWDVCANPFCLNDKPGGRCRSNYRMWKKWWDAKMGVKKRTPIKRRKRKLKLKLNQR